MDILILAECTNRLDIMRAVNSIGSEQFEYCPSYEETWLDIFTRFSQKFVKPILDAPSGYMTIRRVTLPERPAFTLTAVHLASKLRTSGQDQHSEAIDHAVQIRNAENDHDTNTIVIGDFNMNPFESGLVDASGFHAVMDRTTVWQESRIVKGQEYPFFYNPMWNYLGDISDFTPGTYLANSSC